jgi:hypothetical protein
VHYEDDGRVAVYVRVDNSVPSKSIKDWNEEDHPRDEDGKFGEGGGGGSSPAASPNSGTVSVQAPDENATQVSVPIATAERANALRYWQGDGYKETNSALRLGRTTSEASDQLAKMTAAGKLEQDVTLWRSIRLDPTQVGQILGGEHPVFQVGQTIGDKGFFSTSKSFDDAARVLYANVSGSSSENSVIFKVDAPAGTSALDVSAFWESQDAPEDDGSGFWEDGTQQNGFLNENEVIFSPNTKWEIYDIGGATDQFATTIHVRAVD